MSNIQDNSRPKVETCRAGTPGGKPSDEPPSAGAVGPTTNRACNVDVDIEVEINIDPQVTAAIDVAGLSAAAIAAANHSGFTRGTIGIRVTDDVAIRQINAKHLGHDWATDVISFGYSDPPQASKTDPPQASQKDQAIEGELVISVCTASRLADELGWATLHELMLYVVHGTLHIAGMDDQNDDDRIAMRAAEAAVMNSPAIKSFGVDRFDRVAVDRVDESLDRVDTVAAPGDVRS